MLVSSIDRYKINNIIVSLFILYLNYFIYNNSSLVLVLVLYNCKQIIFIILFFIFLVYYKKIPWWSFQYLRKNLYLKKFLHYLYWKEYLVNYFTFEIIYYYFFFVNNLINIGAVTIVDYNYFNNLFDTFVICNQDD